MTEGAAVGTESRGRGFWRDAFETLLMAVVLFVAVRFSLQNTRVEGHSMEPTLQDGQYLMVTKLAYRFGEPQRGDIVVFPSPQEPDRILIKRVVGLPGEEVSIRDGAVYLGATPLDEPYLDTQHGRTNWGPIQVPAGAYVLLGDNREHSNDSRSFGPVSRQDIVGRAWFSLWPPGATIGDQTSAN